MNALLVQQLKEIFKEGIKKNDLSDELKNFISQIEASYSKLTEENVLLHDTLTDICEELNETNKNVMGKNHNLYELLQKRSIDLKIQTKKANETLNLLNQYKEAIDTSFIVTRTDPEGIITYANSNFCKMSGYSQEEVMHHSHNIIRHPDADRELYPILWKIIKNKKIWRGNIHNQKKNGSSYYVHVTIVPFLDIDGNIESYMSFQRNITARIIAQKKLKSMRERTSAIFNHQESAVVITNRKQGLIEANQSFFRLFGFKNLKEFKKNHFGVCDLFQVKDGYLKPNTHDHYWANTTLNAPDKLHRAIILNENGEERTFKVHSQKIDLDGEISILSSFTDISEHENLLLKSEEAQRAKSEFLANMSHEIRTPLNGVFGFLQLLETTNLNPMQKEYINIAQGSMKTLISLVDSVLDFSKIESGKIEKDIIEINIHHLFKSIYETFLPIAQHKNIIYTLEIDPNIYESFKIDEQHIRQILQNFIDNALKFTAENGSVTLCIVLISAQKDTQRIGISVQDSGIGISEDKLETIVQPFSQADSSTTRKFGGTGLGLSISKSLIELLGSEMHIISEEGKGSTFYFELDTTICHHSEQDKQKDETMTDLSLPDVVKHAAHYKEEETLNILIAEDYEVNRMFIGMLLNNYNKITYDFAHNGQEVINMLNKNNPYDIILMDINMPIMNGCEATVIIREEMKLDIPIIALTANALEGDREKFLSKGMNDYLAKPLKITDIDAIIKKYRPHQVRLN